MRMRASVCRRRLWSPQRMQSRLLSSSLPPSPSPESIHHSFAVSGLQRGPSPLFRFSLGLEAWFQLPEHGMQQPEILSRSSVFLTPVASGCTSKRQLHVVTTAHVTHPWLYRRFYPGLQYDWLDAVYQEAVRVNLTLREPVTGLVAATVPLVEPRVHPDLDLVVYSVKEEEHESLLLDQYNILPLAFTSDDGCLGASTVLVGHDKTDDDRLVPCWLNGTISGMEDGHMVVATSGGQSVMGMCGGPALVQVGGDAVAVAGMTFARVEGSHPLQGSTLLIAGSRIKKFIETGL